MPKRTVEMVTLTLTRRQMEVVADLVNHHVGFYEENKDDPEVFDQSAKARYHVLLNIKKKTDEAIGSASSEE